MAEDKNMPIKDGLGGVFDAPFRDNGDATYTPRSVTEIADAGPVATEVTLDAMRAEIAALKALVEGRPAGDSTQPLTAQLSGSTLAEQQTQADAVGGVLTFSAAIDWVEIINEDSVNAGVFTVNGVAIRVPPEVTTGVLRIGGTPSASVTVTGSTAYVINRRA